MTGRELLRDAALPGAVALLGAFELSSLGPDGWGYGIVLECVACLLLVWRRRYPLTACTAAAVAVLTMPWIGPQLDEPATPILVAALVAYSLARRLPDLRGLLGMGVIALMLLVDYGLVDGRDHGPSDVIFVAALFAPPYVLGRLTRKLAAQATQLRLQHALIRDEAMRAERARIARELHDVIAHSVSAMVVQTAAAQDLVRTDPDRAGAVLEDVAAIGRHALSETGRLLHVIRDDADELGLRPAPGMAMLSELVARFRDSGLDIDFELDGPLRELPAGLDVSAYRIVQEALTNALKYAADRATSLRLTSTPTTLQIRTSNVSGDPGSVGGSGLGLVGMAERVSLFGGTLSHGVTVDGRFELDAVLPVMTGEL
ncbi:MAG TPA: histidine kinase [Nocardioidaceae bacterium]|nr:histidine kinase [Nocardioidaceae bacterium]